MAQRNPMNDRYQGEGPQGKTRKSAAKLKPKAEAASTVHIEAKPTTKQERKAAQKRRKSQLEAKERERQRKAKERERKQREAAGEVIEEPKPPTMLEKVKKIFTNPDKKPSAKEGQAEAGAKKAAGKGDGRGAGASTARDDLLPLQTVPTWHRGPDTPEYRRLKYTYWAMLAGGLGAAALSLILTYLIPSELQNMALNAPLIIAYAAIIGALILDTTKIKKIQRAHMAQGTGRKSPKQVKHARQQAEAAALLEQSKKAQKDQKRANSKIPFVKGKSRDESSSESEQEDPDSSDAPENESSLGTAPADKADLKETTKEAKEE
ncbi:MAG: hypothetical protein FWE41_04800 [Coriobacteriia bacterium]|nr:hypothetical protein [Coriobacteriia bacterium]